MPGYRNIPTSDPVEADLRRQWYDAQTAKERDAIGYKLSTYLWDRVVKQVELDRKRHPKAKRNQLPPKDHVYGTNRVLP